MKKKGFTLIEVLASLAVFCVLFVAIGSVFYSVYLNWIKQRNFNQNFQQLCWAMEFISNDIRHANEGSLGYGSGERLLELTGYADPAGQDIYYSLNNTNHILFRSCDGYQSVMAASISDANFQIEAGGLVTIALTTRPNPGIAEGRGNRNLILKTTVRTRN